MVFYDGARVGGVQEREHVAVRHDVGCGLRIGFTGALLLRVDYGYRLADGVFRVAQKTWFRPTNTALEADPTSGMSKSAKTILIVVGVLVVGFVVLFAAALSNID